MTEPSLARQSTHYSASLAELEGAQVARRCKKTRIIARNGTSGSLCIECRASLSQTLRHDCPKQPAALWLAAALLDAERRSRTRAGTASQLGFACVGCVTGRLGSVVAVLRLVGIGWVRHR